MFSARASRGHRPWMFGRYALVAAMAVAPAAVLAQTAVPSTAPAASPAPGAHSPAVPLAPSAESSPTPAPAAPAPTLAPEAPANTEAFVGTVTADKVYVRSGPGSSWYELGHLAKGDTVQVVGSKNGWYQIFPPNGTFCLIAWEFVEPDADGTTGTVKNDYINLRAGTAMYKQEGYVKDGAVLCVLRKGTKLTILGTAGKYDEVAPTDRAYVYINAQFVKPAPGTEYKIPNMKPGGDITGAAKDTVTTVAPLPSSGGPGAQAPLIPGETPQIRPPEGSATAGAGGSTSASGTSGALVPGGASGASVASTMPDNTRQQPPEPTAKLNTDAYAKYAALNKRYQAELQKPVGTRELDGLITDYKALLTTKEAPPASVKEGTEARLAALEKLQTIQRLQKQVASSADAFAAQKKALEAQYAEREKAIQDYQRSQPYLAEGTLRTSTAVTGKYALVNPETGRTVAYLDPDSQIDIGSLLGKYIGVHGVTKRAAGTDVQVIQVRDATLLPAPQVAAPRAK